MSEQPPQPDAAGLASIEGPIHIVGAGAIGLCMAAAIAASGRTPVLVSGWSEHVAALRDDGLLLVDRDGAKTRHRVDAIDEDAFAATRDVRLAYLAVKSQATERFADLLAQTLAPDGVAVSLQNGLNEPMLARRLGASRVIGAVSPVSAQRTGPGIVRLTGASRAFVLGELDGRITARVQAVASLSNTPPWSTTVTDNIAGALWAKLTNNCRLNPLCVLSGRPLGETVNDPFFLRTMLMIVAEMHRLTQALGVEVVAIPTMDMPKLMAASVADADAAIAMIRAHAEVFADAKPSTLQDFEAGLPTELEHICGAVLAQADEAGLSLPVIRHVTDAVRRLERRGAEARDEVIADLRAALAGSVS